MSKTVDTVVEDHHEQQQVLEFGLDGQRYGVSIDTVAEIVDRTSLTSLPNTPEHVLGVMNLRNETTTIIDPQVVLGTGERPDDGRIIIFDSTDGHQYGWVVDAVFQVSTIDHSAVDDNVDSPVLHGIVMRDDGFLLWVDPTTVNADEAVDYSASLTNSVSD
ncbi:MAG: chemotaxis protein CheW [archaeon]